MTPEEYKEFEAEHCEGMSKDEVIEKYEELYGCQSVESVADAKSITQ